MGWNINGSGNPSSGDSANFIIDACVDLSDAAACNTVSFESTDSYVSELSWTVTSGDDLIGFRIRLF